MTTLTKIFVILVCLFAFIFTPMAIQFAARSYNWRDLAEKYRDHSETALAGQRSAMAIAASQIQYHKDLQAREQEQLNASRAEVARLTEQVTVLQQNLDKLGRLRENSETSVTLLTKEMGVVSRHNEELTTAKEQALDRERELQAQNIRLNDRVKELSANLLFVSQQLNQKLQEVAACREENQTLRQAGSLPRSGGEFSSAGLAGTAQPVSPPAAGPIHGRVREVAGDTVTIDVGTASGLKPGMIMVVRRGDEYIADLEIGTDLSPTEAVGRIKLSGGKTVRANDRVQDLDSFQARN